MSDVVVSQLNSAIRLKSGVDVPLSLSLSLFLSLTEDGTYADGSMLIDYRYHYCCHRRRIVALFATALEDTALMRAIVSMVLPRRVLHCLEQCVVCLV